MNYRYFFTLSLLLIFSQNSFAQTKIVSANSFLHLKSRSEISIPLQNAAYYKVDASVMMKALSGRSQIQITDFPVSIDEYITLDLKHARSVIDSRTQCIVTTPSGDIHISSPDMILYQGKISGEPNSRAFISLSNGDLLCSILRESGATYIFGPEKNSTEAGAHILIPETDLLSGASSFTPFDCNNEALIQPKAPVPIDELLADAHSKSHSSILDNGKLLEDEIAIEADSQFYGAIGGNVNKTIAYIGAIFGMSSMIYENEANITHHLGWIKVWTTSDPYQVHGNAYALPDTVRSYWQSHYSTVKRDVAHVLTSIGYGGGGYGYYSLCDPAYSYSVSSPQTGHQYPTFAFTYDVYIISHEIGHNFGLVHSHDCYWNPPLDTCYTKDDANLSLGDACFSKPVTPRKSPGSLMSYCANANLFLSGNDFSQYKIDMTFSPRVYPVLRANAEKAACIEPPKDPVLILLFPRGSDTYNADTTIMIKLTNPKDTNVSLEYSSDGGTIWSPIKTNVAASSATLAWKVPNVNSKTMLVRVFDAANVTIGDTSLMFFSTHTNAEVDIMTAHSLCLEANRPNPFSRITNFRYSVPNTALVGIFVYDELGKEMSIITDQVQNQGTYTVAFDGSKLPSGNYFIRLNSEGKTVSIKITILNDR